LGRSGNDASRAVNGSPYPDRVGGGDSKAGKPLQFRGFQHNFDGLKATIVRTVVVLHIKKT